MVQDVRVPSIEDRIRYLVSRNMGFRPSNMARLRVNTSQLAIATNLQTKGNQNDEDA